MNRWTMAYGDEFDMPGAVAFFLDGDPVDDEDVLAALNGGHPDPATTEPTTEARLRAHLEATSTYLRVDVLERLARLAEVPIEDEGGPRANFYIVDDLAAALTRDAADTASTTRPVPGVRGFAKDLPSDDDGPAWSEGPWTNDDS